MQTDPVSQVRSLLYPDNIVIVGATPRPTGWAQRIFENLSRFSYPGTIYPINPRYETLWDRPCYPGVAHLGTAPDHLAVLVPASAALPILEEAAELGARSATIFASGFGEGGDPEGKVLGDRLKALVERTGLAVSGPNCLGNLCAASRTVTLTDQRLEKVQVGPVAIVGQSGGVVLFVNSALSHRGVAVGYAVSSGNEAGLKTADYLEFFATDPAVSVIVTFIESIHDAPRFFAACRAVRAAGKTIVAVKIGGSEESRKAAVAHTGSLAGSLAAFDAAAEAYGVIRVDNLDDVVETVEFLSHTHLPPGPRIGAMTYSGGLRELLLEGAQRENIRFPRLTPESERQLQAILPVGTSVGNPLDSGWGGLSSGDIFFQCVDILRADPNIDMVLVQEQLPLKPGEARSETYLAGLDEKAHDAHPKPVAVFSMISDTVSPYGLNFRQSVPHLPIMQEVDKTLRALRAVGNVRPPRREPNAAPGAGDPTETFPAPVLNEVESKRLLAGFNLPVPDERVVFTAEEAVAAARAIGYPVVMKMVARSIPHKSDRGLVKLGLADSDAVLRAFSDLMGGLHPGESHEGVLVSPHVDGGLELVLGIERDPEVGPVLMFGRGGIWLELFQDVRFALPPIDREQALAMIRGTKTGRLLEEQGYRGGPVYDREAVVNALLALSEVALRYGDRLQSVDVNPFVVLPKPRGGLALDALVVFDDPNRKGGPDHER